MKVYMMQPVIHLQWVVGLEELLIIVLIMEQHGLQPNQQEQLLEQQQYKLK